MNKIEATYCVQGKIVLHFKDLSLPFMKEIESWLEKKAQYISDNL